MIFYGEPIQNSTVQSPVTVSFLQAVNTSKGVAAEQLLVAWSWCDEATALNRVADIGLQPAAGQMME